MTVASAVEARAAQERAAAMVYDCPKCGRRVLGTQMFCTGCGTPTSVIKEAMEEADAAIHHLCHGSELGTQTVLLVVEPQVHARAIRQKIAVEERVENVLRIVLVVLYLPVIGHVCRI